MNSKIIATKDTKNTKKIKIMKTTGGTGNTETILSNPVHRGLSFFSVFLGVLRVLGG
jgi:hypothetical protein